MTESYGLTPVVLEISEIRYPEEFICYAGVRLKIYTMHNIFSNFLCFASDLFAYLSSILNNFNCNDENWILGK